MNLERCPPARLRESGWRDRRNAARRETGAAGTMVQYLGMRVDGSRPHSVTRPSLFTNSDRLGHNRRSGPRSGPFEEHAVRYDQWFERHKHAYESELLALRELVPQTPRSIEIGVGSGRFAAPLSVRFGVEPSPKMAKLSRARGIDVVLGVAEALPFENLRFDLALMVTTVCFLDDISTSFEEAYRILKPEGAFVVGFIDRDSPLGMAYQGLKERNPFYAVATFRSVREVLTHLRDAGFVRLQIRQTVSHGPRGMASVEEPREGHGLGSFVVIRGMRSVNADST